MRLVDCSICNAPTEFLVRIRCGHKPLGHLFCAPCLARIARGLAGAKKHGLHKFQIKCPICAEAGPQSQDMVIFGQDDGGEGEGGEFVCPECQRFASPSVDRVSYHILSDCAANETKYYITNLY